MFKWFKNKIANIAFSISGDIIEQRVKAAQQSHEQIDQRKLQEGASELASVLIEPCNNSNASVYEKLQHALSDATICRLHLRHQIAYTIHLLKIVQPFAGDDVYFDALKERDRNILLQQADAILGDEDRRKTAVANGILAVNNRIVQKSLPIDLLDKKK